MDLTVTREKINAIDIQLLKLYEERMDLCRDVAAYKIENNMQVLDRSREEVILERVRKDTGNKEYEEYAVALFEKIMEMSRDMQTKMIEAAKGITA